MATLPDLPNVSAPNFLQRVRESMMTMLGRQGDPLQKAVTVEDLVGAGVIAVPGAVGKYTVVIRGSTTGDPAWASDMTPPPIPTGLTVSASISHIIIEHDEPGYTQGGGHGLTVVYGVPYTSGSLPVFGDAIEVGQFTGTIFALPSNPATQWHIWIKWKSRAGALSDPAGGTNGATATTGQDIAKLLEALTGHIKLGQLYTDLARSIQSLENRFDDLASDTLKALMAQHKSRKSTGAEIVRTQRIVQDGDESLAEQITLLSAGLGDANALIVDEQIARANADSALASDITALEATVGDNTAAILNEQTARVSADEAIALDITALEVEVGNTNAAVLVETTARANADTALASSISTVEAIAGDNAAAIAAEASARASLDGSVQSLYTVRASVTSEGRTVVGGFGLAATSTAAGGPEIEFGVRADRFWIGAPSTESGIDDVLPFVVQTSDEVVNGVTIPKGVYMDAAHIKNLHAIVANLGEAWIDWTMVIDLNAIHLKAGDGTIGGPLKSSNFVTGVSGWQVEHTGEAEFNDVTVRGTVYASAGTFAGALSAATGTFAGNLSAAGGTFSGALSAATGSFTGSLSGANITGATGTFSGSVVVGTSPAISGTTMTGTGFVANASGTFAAGNSSNSIVWDGTTLTINKPTIVAPDGPVELMGDHYVDSALVDGSGSETVIGGLEFRSDGTIQSYVGNSVDGYAYDQIGLWYSPVTSSIGSGYEVVFTVLGGDTAYLTNPAPPPGGASLAFNVQIQMSRTTTTTTFSHSCNGTYTVRTTAGDTVGSGSWFVAIGREP